MATPARTTTIALAWLGAVVGSTLIGLTAVGAIGEGLVGPGASRVLDAAEVDAQLAAQLAAVPVSTPPEPAPTDSAAPTTEVPAEPAPAVLAGVGGVVVARCDGEDVEVVSVTPAQGYRAGGRLREDGWIRFEGEDVEVGLRLSCRGGEPVIAEETTARPGPPEVTPAAPVPVPGAEPARVEPPLPTPGAEPPRPR